MAVEWTAAQYVTRVLVDVARQTGQPMRDVLGEPFALTLWTWAELAQIAREESVERLGERTDLAGLVAVAFHEPASLQKAEFRYLSAAGKLTRMLDAQRERLTQLAQRMAMATPTEGP